VWDFVHIVPFGFDDFIKVGLQHQEHMVDLLIRILFLHLCYSLQHLSGVPWSIALVSSLESIEKAIVVNVWADDSIFVTDGRTPFKNSPTNMSCHNCLNRPNVCGRTPSCWIFTEKNHGSAYWPRGHFLVMDRTAFSITSKYTSVLTFWFFHLGWPFL
jgi:hypothetical protein